MRPVYCTFANNECISSLRSLAVTVGIAAAFSAGTLQSAQGGAELELVAQLLPLSAGEGAMLDHFGLQFAIDGSTALLGVPYDDIGSLEDAGSVYFFRRHGQAWVLDRKIAGSEALQHYGVHVDVDGDVAAAADRPESVDTPRQIEIFRRGVNGWETEATVATANSFYYASLALHGDILVSCDPGADGPAGNNQGLISIYRHSMGDWPLLRSFYEADAEPNALFGSTVDLYGSPFPTVVVGVPSADITVNGNTVEDVGRVVVFSPELGAQGQLRYTQTQTLHSAPLLGNGRFGHALSISGAHTGQPDRLWVGAPDARIGDLDQAGAAFRFHLDGTTWQQAGPALAALDPVDQGHFGYSIDVDGQRLAIGAPGFLDEGATAGGEVYAGHLQANQSPSLQLLNWPGNAPTAAGLGTHVAIDATSATLLTAAHFATVHGNFKQGALLTSFGISDEPLLPAFQLMDRGQGLQDARAGSAFAVDGDWALLAAPFMAIDDQPARGAVFAYRRNGTQWQYKQRILAPDGAAGDGFGTRIALSNGVALIGASGREVSAVNAAGAAYAFAVVGGQWQIEAVLSAALPQAEAEFGFHLCLAGDVAVITDFTSTAFPFLRTTPGVWVAQASIDMIQDNVLPMPCAVQGNTLAIGIPGRSLNGNARAGAVQLFALARNGNALNVLPQAQFTGNAVDQTFGRSVAMGGDTLAVGFRGGDNTRDRVQTYTRSGSTWLPAGVLAASDGVAYDGFGSALATSGDRLLIGALGAFVDSVAQVQAAYVFERSNGFWGEVQKLTRGAGAGSEQDWFGAQVAISADQFFVAAPRAGGTAPFGNPDEGRVLIFAQPGDAVFTDGFE